MLRLQRLSMAFSSSSKLHIITMIRHGQSIWNKQKRWAGWTDIPLSPQGINEAKECAKLLKQRNMKFDTVYTSVLNRAVTSANLIMEGLGLHGVPLHKQWRLNEKHYGALQGCCKVQAHQKYGAAQVDEWRRSSTVRPPPAQPNHEAYLLHNPNYKSINPSLLPNGQNLSDILNRVKPLWESEICSDLRKNKNVLVVAHGSSIRALLRIIRPEISDAQVRNFNIPNATPVVFTLDQGLNFVKSEFIGDLAEIQRKMKKVKHETQKKET